MAIYEIKQKSIDNTKLTLSQILDSMYDGVIVTDPEGNIIYINKSFEKILGYNKKQIQEEGFGALFDFFKKRFEFPDRGFILNEFKAKRRDGGYIDISISYSPIKNKDGHTIGFLCIIRDITEKKKTEDEIKKTRDFLEILFKTSPDAIITTDMRGIITSFNDAAEKMFGYKAEEVIGKPARIFISDKRKLHEVIKLSVEKGIVKDYEIPFRAKNGNDVLMSLSYAILKDENGNPIGTVGISRDITEKKKIEEEIKKKYEELERFNRLMIGRELKMVELKKRIRELELKLSNKNGIQ